MFRDDDVNTTMSVCAYIYMYAVNVACADVPTAVYSVASDSRGQGDHARNPAQ
jgi:hypothetical protein